MKKILRLTIAFLLVFFVSTTGCGTGQTTQTERDLHDFLRYTVLVRLDRQRDIYRHLGSMLEDYLVSKNRDDMELQFRNFCLGVNCFVRDDSTYRCCNDLYQSNPALSDTLIAIMSTTARNELEHLSLSAFSDDALKKLKVLCYELENCCNRGEEGTFANYINIQDDGDALYEEALSRANHLLQEFDETVALKGDCESCLSEGDLLFEKIKARWAGTPEEISFACKNAPGTGLSGFGGVAVFISGTAPPAPRSSGPRSSRRRRGG